MDGISTIATIVTTVSVLIGFVFALLELRHLTATRKTETIMKIYESRLQR
jgi:ABC-type phosphate/phosphonate transport system permease subunit